MSTDRCAAWTDTESSDLTGRSRTLPPMSVCRATNRAGDPCRMPAQRGAAHCFTHNPLNATELAGVAATGGHASGVTRRRISHNRRLRREEAISLFDHSDRCICLACTALRMGGLKP